MTRHNPKRARVRRPLMPAYELAAYSVFGFCLTHGLSRSKLYDMLRRGDGPRVMKCGTRTLISVEAAQAWRRGRERVLVAFKARASRTAGGRHRIRPRIGLRGRTAR